MTLDELTRLTYHTMRGLIPITARLLSGIVGVAALWLPVIGMGFLSFIYLRACAATLSAPGTSLAHSYESQAGYGRVVLQHVRFDWEKLSAQAEQAEIFSSEGLSVARFDQPRVKKTGESFHISLNNLKAKLEKQPDGTFNYEGFLPKQAPEGEGVPFVIELDQAEVELWDRSLDEPTSDTLLLRNLKAEGVGEQIVAAADAQVKGAGNFRWALHRTAEGTGSLALNLKRVELAKLTSWIKGWISPEDREPFEPAQASSLISEGKLTLTWAKDKKLELEGEVKADFEGLRLGNYLDQASGSVTAKLAHQTTEFVLQTHEPGRGLNFQGWADWGDKPKLYGDVRVSLSNKNVAWPELKEALPKELGFQNANFQGQVSLQNEQWHLTGDLLTGQANWLDERVNQSNWKLSLASESLGLQLLKGSYLGRPATGALELRFRDGQWKGFANLGNGDLRPLAKKWGIDNLSGTAAVSALIEGTVEKPLVSLSAQGQAKWTPKEGEPIVFERWNARARADAEKLELHQLQAQGDTGYLLAKGSYRWKDSGLDTTVEAKGFSLSLLGEDWRGQANFKGSLKGSVEKPEIRGKLAVVQPKVADQELPDALAELFYGGNKLLLTEIQAFQGLAKGTGELEWNTKTDALKGAFEAQNLDLSQWLGEEFGFLAELKQGRLSGTLQSPKLVADWHAPQGLLFGVPIDSAQGKLQVSNKTAQLLETVLTTDGGKATGSGEYDFEGETWTANLQLDNLPLDVIKQERVGIGTEGKAKGQAKLRGKKNELEQLDADLQVTDLRVNQTYIGSGTSKIAFLDQKWHASALLGSTERYLQLDSLNFDPQTDQVELQALAYNLRLKDLLTMFREELQETPERVNTLLAGLDANLDADVQVTGNRNQLDFDLKSFGLNQVRLGGRSIGSLSALASKKQNIWNVKQLTWDPPGDGILQVQGNFDPEGAIQADAELSQLDLSLIKTFLPEAPFLTGKANSSLVFSGKTKDPDIQGSARIDLEKVVTDNNAEQNLPLRADFSELRIKSQKLDAEGVFHLKGFTGGLKANADLERFVQGHRPPEPSLTLTASLNEREVGSLSEYFPSIDPRRSFGKFKGDALLTYNGQEIDLEANLQTQKAGLALKDVQTALRDLDLSVQLKDNQLTAIGQANSSEGGRVALNLSGPVEDPFASGQTLENMFQKIGLAGSFDLERFRAAQNRGDLQYASTLEGKLRFTGSWMEPRLAGMVTMHGTNLLIPSELPQGGPAPSGPFNPIFEDVKVVTDDARVRASQTDLVLSGLGQLKGSLQTPDFSMPLTLRRGTLRLPTTRVNLEPGGGILVSYSQPRGGEPRARVDLNLEGHTVITARRFTDSVETYDVFLTVRGNLLDEAGPRIDATSSPPDLSRDQILAILGQRDIIESLGGNVRSQANLTPTLAGLALPSLVDPITSELSKTFKLDYLAFEYNPFDQTIIRAAKTLGKGLVLQARRQLVTPAFGRLRYEIKLTYRLPLKDDFWNRLRVSVGTDQDRPWKISLEYSFRF